MTQDPVLLGERRTVKPVRVRLRRFVEFEFCVDSEDLTVELVMPWPELVSFAARNDAVWLSPAPEAVDEVRRLAFAHGDAALIESIRDQGGPS